MSLLVASIRGVDFNFGSIVAHPISTVYFFTWLKSLVDLKEVFNFI